MTREVETKMNEILEIRNHFGSSYTSRLGKVKRISAKVEEIDDAWDIVNKVMSLVRSLKEDDDYLLGKHVSEFMIMNELKGLVLPKSVRYQLSNRRCKDLLIREEFDINIPSFSNVSYSSYMDAVATLRRFVKKSGNDEMTPLSSIRKDATLNDVIDIACINGKVKYDGTPFVPVVLDAGLDIMFKDTYYNSDCAEVIEDFIINLIN